MSKKTRRSKNKNVCILGFTEYQKKALIKMMFRMDKSKEERKRKIAKLEDKLEAVVVELMNATKNKLSKRQYLDLYRRYHEIATELEAVKHPR